MARLHQIFGDDLHLRPSILHHLVRRLNHRHQLRPHIINNVQRALTSLQRTKRYNGN